MESRVRMLIVLAGLPEPTTNHVIRYPNGDWRRRLDLSYVGEGSSSSTTAVIT